MPKFLPSVLIKSNKFLEQSEGGVSTTPATIVITIKDDPDPTAQLTRFDSTLTAVRWGENAQQTGDTTPAWTAIANANGEPDGSVANTLATGAPPQTSELQVDCQPFTNKTSYTIDDVDLDVYFDVTVTLLGAEWYLQYNIGSGWVTMVDSTSGATVDYSVTPFNFDLTGIATTWTHLNDLQVRLQTVNNVGQTYEANFDGITVTVQGSISEVL